MDLGQWIMIGLSVTLAIWFAGGFIYNRRRGETVSRWMVNGMKYLGEISDIAWIGSSASGGRMVVKEARKPFRQVEAVFLLESREILPIWIFNRIRGKTDEAIIKTDLHSTPKEAIEITRYNFQKGQRLDPKTSQEGAPPGMIVSGFKILSSSKGLESDYSKISTFLEKYGSGVQKISIDRKKPHLILRLRLPNLLGEPPEAVFEALLGIVK
ncbi:MAG: hypothetical protein IBX69_02215 [Anaerolineales bacterium]|nr:hypothetical protein [Anaerolineales bacterium]